MPPRSFQTTFSHTAPASPTESRFRASSARPAVFNLSLWQPTQYRVRSVRSCGGRGTACAEAWVTAIGARDAPRMDCGTDAWACSKPMLVSVSPSHNVVARNIFDKHYSEDTAGGNRCPQVIDFTPLFADLSTNARLIQCLVSCHFA